MVHSMDNHLLPAVRVPTVQAGDDGDVLETPLVDLPPSEKFGFAYPDKQMVTPNLPQSAALDPESSELETSEGESQESSSSPHNSAGKGSADHTPTNEQPNSNGTTMAPSSPPRISRAFSMPLPSQLGHLQNPHRTPYVTTARDTYFPLPSPLALSQSPNGTRLQELSLELADSVQMVIQTLLQISPPHLLDPAKEQFSACSLSVPSPSISAMLTAMKNLNYMSANMSSFTDNYFQASMPGTSVNTPPLHSPILEDFDIGEMLQSVGDALSGLAAQTGVELVLFHGDVGMKHVSLKGDEGGISYALSHVIRQILDTAQSGDTLEVGLFISPETNDSRESGQDSQESDNESRSLSRASTSSLLPDFDGPLRCTFEIGHKFGTPDSVHIMGTDPHSIAGTSLFRAKPRLDTTILRRLLTQIGGTVKEELQPRLFSPGRTCELTVVLEPGSAEILTQPPKMSPEDEALRQPYASMNIQLATEPSLDELFQFADSLKGKKVSLYASARGSFAHHLTSYLTAWGLDVSHMSMAFSDDDASDTVSAVSIEESAFRTSPTVMMTDSPIPVEINPVEEQMREKAVNSNAAFVIIDDDVSALRNRLLQLRTETPFNLNLRQRPKLSAHHRPKSSPQIFRAKGIKPTFVPQQPVVHPVIIHFTSLQNYKLVKDVIHTVLSTPNSNNLIPEIIVLPKPAGPRRVLTALRTALLKPIVDPFFSPIATSPMSPNGQGVNPFSPFGANTSPLQKTNRPAISPRTASDRSSRSSKEAVELVPRLPPSPLRESDSMEYFSEAAEKLGTSPSSGLVIQSPDGQPAGIFFHPRGANSRAQRSDNSGSGGGTVVNPPNLVRDGGNLRLPGEHRRTSLPRRPTPQGQGGAEMTPDERPKPFSRPGPARHRSGLAYFSDIASVASSEANSPAHTPGTRWIRKPASPREEKALPLPPQITNTAPTPPVPVPADDGGARAPRVSPGLDRKSMSPPGSPVANRTTATPGTPGGAKRSFTRRGTQDSPQNSPGAVVKKGKQSADGNIVPPVNVLIVEDNPINQTILSTFMRKKKIKYDVAKNGAEAVAKWKTGSFHLILMDIQMPVMDGIEATKEIRRLEHQASGNAFASTPPLDGEQTPSDAPSVESKSTLSVQTPFRSSVIIVALTASSLQTDRVAALAAGCNDFLTKPVSLLWLNNKIIEWGSIKALQMWADLRPEVVKSISSGQVSQAKAIASKLHVPENRKSRSPPPSKAPKPVTSTMDAMRMLSSPNRIPLVREVDAIESDHSDVESRVTPADTSDARTPMARTESGSSGSSADPPASSPEDSRNPKNSPLIAPRERTGEDALRAHIKDSANTAFSLATRNALDRPIVLGERTISGGAPSIAEVMHDEDSEATQPSPPSVYASAQEDNIEDDVPDEASVSGDLPNSKVELESKENTTREQPTTSGQ